MKLINWVTMFVSLLSEVDKATFVSQLLDGVAGHLLEVIVKEEVAPEIRDGFLAAMNRLVSKVSLEVAERLGEEYASQLGSLVDLLYNADQYSQQATLVDLLRR